MKSFFRKLFAPILNYFETGEEESYSKSSRRTILIAVGFLFVLLSMVSLVAMVTASQFGAVLPFAIFFATGSVCLIVGLLGADEAVRKIWGNK